MPAIFLCKGPGQGLVASQSVHDKHRPFVGHRFPKMNNPLSEDQEESSVEPKTAVVLGATGVIGRYLVQHLSAHGWEVIGIARSASGGAGAVRYLPVDLLDPADCRQKFRQLETATHLFYAAYQEHADPSDQVLANTAMLQNSLTSLDAAARNLRRVVLMEGVKAYGAHLGPFKTPARETDPRHMPPNFYYTQEDFLRQYQQRRRWTWSVLRPDVVCGLSIGSPMNLAMVIAVYAIISKALGLPLRFPGKPGAYRALAQVTDAALLARATEWAATEERCANEIFNVTNGDLFRWEYLWPKFAEFFAMEYEPPQTISLAERMADKRPVWEELVMKHGLQPIPYEKVAAWAFGDFVFGCDYDVISETTKLRQFGFHDVEESQAMFLRLFREFREQKVIP